MGKSRWHPDLEALTDQRIRQRQDRTPLIVVDGQVFELNGKTLIPVQDRVVLAAYEWHMRRSPVSVGHALAHMKPCIVCWEWMARYRDCVEPEWFYKQTEWIM